MTLQKNFIPDAAAIADFVRLQRRPLHWMQATFAS